METEVIMNRELFGMKIKQKSKTQFFSATDLIKAGNNWRAINGLSYFHLDWWLKQESTKEFIKALENKFGQVKISSRGNGGQTWVHPFLFIDLALALSPSLKLEVYDWIYDHLLKYRNDSGDSYKKMTGAIWIKISNKAIFKDFIARVAGNIKLVCHVDTWENASEDQLAMRDKIHENIALLCDILPNVNEAVRLGILKTKMKELNK